jgi:hypothetical protein
MISQENLLLICQLLGKALNSRINLALLLFAYTASPWGLAPKLDEIQKNTAALKQVEAMTIRNSERLAVLVERCQIKITQ